MTLVLLVTAATGAWAGTGLFMVKNSDTSATIKYGEYNQTSDIYFDGGWEDMNGILDGLKSSCTTITVDASCQNFTTNTYSGLFDGWSALTTINNIENLNMTGVTSMTRMFAGCSSLQTLDLSSWNVSSVTTLSLVFLKCTSLTTVDLRGWNTSNVEDMSQMFSGCSSLKNIYVGDGWSTANVPDNSYKGNELFLGCTNLPNWNTDNPVTNKSMAKLVTEGGYLKTGPDAAAPTGPEVTQVPNTTDEWQFTMPAGNVLVDVEYKDLTAMALTFGGKAIPEAGVKGFLGFEQEFIDGLNLDAAVTNTDQNGAAVTTDATSYTYTSSDATVIGFKTATEGVYELSGALADMEFRQEGTATLTIQYAGTEDLGKSAETALLVTVTEKTYTVDLAEGTADADNWQGKIGDNGTYAALPVEGLKGSEKVVLKYDGSRIVKRVTATVEGAAPAGPKTYTELKGGEVLHVGDILDFSDANVQYIFDGYLLNQPNCPFTVLRANITGDKFDPTVTPADDGEYYVMQAKGGDYYFAGKNLPATATSDGILITINSEDGNYRYCTASVHEKE